MNKIVRIIIPIIKIYQLILSPLLGANKCRYFPSCSEYFIESLKTHGLYNGFKFGIKRVLSCHPIKILGGGSGLDLVPKKRK